MSDKTAFFHFLTSKTAFFYKNEISRFFTFFLCSRAKNFPFFHLFLHTRAKNFPFFHLFLCSRAHSKSFFCTHEHIVKVFFVPKKQKFHFCRKKQFCYSKSGKTQFCHSKLLFFYFFSEKKIWKGGRMHAMRSNENKKKATVAKDILSLHCNHIFF